jgi:hypothetical protein
MIMAIKTPMNIAPFEKVQTHQGQFSIVHVEREHAPKVCSTKLGIVDSPAVDANASDNQKVWSRTQHRKQHLQQ